MVQSVRVDQLRGVAALAVVLCHVAGSAEHAIGDPSGQPHRWIAYVLCWGFLGVPLFFVLSGFCIHLAAARARAAGDDTGRAWGTFFRRRFWRLYPPYLVSLVLAAGVLLAATGTLPAGPLGILAQAFLVHTLHPATFDGVNPPAWTLAIEAQLYLAYPIVWWLFGRLGAWRGAGVIAAVTLAYRAALSARWVPEPFGAVAWAVFPSRWLEWALGALVAEWAVGRARIPAGLRHPLTASLMLAASIRFEWEIWREGFFVLRDPLQGLAFALVLVTALDREERLHAARDRAAPRTPSPSLASPRWLALDPVGRWLRTVGLYSYSLYLVHRPIQLAAEAWVGGFVTTYAPADGRLLVSLALTATTTPLVLVVARAFHRSVEAPSVAIARGVGGSPPAVLSAAGGRAPATHRAP